MLRRTIALFVSAALCSTSLSPALAQDHRPAAFDTPAGADTAARGTSATVNIRVPLGGRPERSWPGPSLGLTVGYGQVVGARSSDARPVVRRFRLADFRLDRQGLSRAELASFDLANLERDGRLNLQETTRNKKSWLVVGGLFGLALGACILWVCNSDGVPDTEEFRPDPSRPVG